MVSTSPRSPKLINTSLVFLLALALVGFAFFLQENIGLNLADEGSLWYGAIRTSQGDVPLRDFRSYAPGRYYWIAAGFWILGQKIMAMRLSIALFEVIGLTFGLLAVRRVVTSWWLLGLVGLLLLAWMFPRHKLFEPGLHLVAVYVALCFIENPTPKRYFIAGVFTGLSSFIGFNHGLYTFLTFFLLLLFIRFKLKQGSLLKSLSLWGAGVTVGYIPLLFMLVAIPGMFAGFMRWTIYFINFGHTNLPLPIPWPWTVDYAQLDLLSGVSQFFEGFFFLLLPLFYLFAITRAILAKQADLPGQSLLIAAAFVGVTTMHHAFDRADLSHLSQNIQPLLIGLVAWPTASRFQLHKKIIVSLAGFLLISTNFTILIPANPYIAWLKARDTFTPYPISGDQLWLNKDQAAYIDTVKQLATRYIRPHEGLWIVPHSPGLYPILERESPTWNPYLLLPEQEEPQLELISDLIKHQVNWVLLEDQPLDGRDELRFRYTHPLVWQYLMTEFEPVEALGLPGNQRLLHLKLPYRPPYKSPPPFIRLGSAE